MRHVPYRDSRLTFLLQVGWRRSRQRRGAGRGHGSKLAADVGVMC